ncbi:hypothetical protein HELRODRAFT_179897 [Helobdella robusta]|uniref:Uncharacterized protein n=1 Tax=Helobdella robusta TaxID=6412 RepID=T1FF86_HELRO|nr:hypothetical protein HELRODRAFT_179897 [Helobdella robusta]ESN95038.1 hypothetical protein HELRODRAFT_179897 [Helobdella robusta]
MEMTKLKLMTVRNEPQRILPLSVHNQVPSKVQVLCQNLNQVQVLSKVQVLSRNLQKMLCQDLNQVQVFSKTPSQDLKQTHSQDLTQVQVFSKVQVLNKAAGLDLCKT